jgi:chromosomal replication initiator protein
MPDAVDDVFRIVSEYFGVSVVDVRSQRRSRDVHPVRLWAAYVAVATTGASYAMIGARMGRRDESIIRMYARNRERAVAQDVESARVFAELTAAVRQ